MAATAGSSATVESDEPKFRGSPDAEGVRRAKKVFVEAYGDPPRKRGPVVIEDGPLVAGFDDDGDGDGDGGGDGV